jgi:hypothetical protein
MIFKISARRVSDVVSIDTSPSEPLPSLPSLPSLPTSVTIDLDVKSYCAGLEITESGASAATFGSWGGQSPQRLKRYALYNDATGKKIIEGVFCNQRGRKWIPLGGVKAARLRLELLEGYDTRRASAAACWSMGWGQYMDDVLSISANADNVIQYANNANELWERNCSNSIKLRDGIKKVVCGNDNRFYYIDANDEIVGFRDAIKAKDIAVSHIFGAYYITLDGRLKQAGYDEDLIDGFVDNAGSATSISFDSEGTLYIAAGLAAYRFHIKSRNLEPYKTPYKIVKIAPGRAGGYIAVSTPSGKIHMVNRNGDNSFIIGYDCHDLSCGANGALWQIIAASPGKSRIKGISMVNYWVPY